MLLVLIQSVSNGTILQAGVKVFVCLIQETLLRLLASANCKHAASHRQITRGLGG
jgi:hypothetical protein